jgi:predicted aminopeptidase
MIRKILLGILLVLVVLVLWNWSLVVYGVEQGWGQARIIWNARPIAEILADPQFPDSLKAKLRLIGEIRKFGIDSLGLNDSKNYQTVYDQKGKEVMWVVMASEPFQLKPKLWHFPIVGTVPYRGYFNQQKAIAEGKKLEREGFDISIRNPGGWSTLGWFTDPILSHMLEQGDGDLASLILHEMVHATLWVKDSVDFNENLATFIGDTAAYNFLAYKFGRNSKEYSAYFDGDRNYRRYSAHMLRGAEGLDSLYRTMTSGEAVAAKRKKKEQFIRRIVTNLDTLSWLPPNATRPSKRFSNHLPNNAYFMSFRHYDSKLDLFKKEMNEKSPGDLKGYLRYLTEKFPR